MTRYAGLLRAVNLGPTNRVAMPSLREWVADLGYTEVKTYLASGNVVFTSTADDAGSCADKIADRILDETDSAIDVLVRTHDDLTQALDRNPFPDADTKQLLFAFLEAKPMPEAVAKLAAVESGRDEVHIDGGIAYLHCPDGIGRSKLATRFGKLVGVVATARNQRTVAALADLTES